MDDKYKVWDPGKFTEMWDSWNSIIPINEVRDSAVFSKMLVPWSDSIRICKVEDSSKVTKFWVSWIEDNIDEFQISERIEDFKKSVKCWEFWVRLINKNGFVLPEKRWKFGFCLITINVLDEFVKSIMGW